MVTGEIIQQVFSIRSPFGTGTGFTVRVDGRQYLITARHLYDDDGRTSVASQPSVEVRHNGQWKPLSCQLVGVGEGDHDIVILAAAQPLAHFGEITLGSKGVIYSQEVYFLGFPYGL